MADSKEHEPTLNSEAYTVRRTTAEEKTHGTDISGEDLHRLFAHLST